MSKADYGFYGTITSFVVLAVVAGASFFLTLLVEDFRVASAVVFVASVGVAAFLVFLSRGRASLVSQVVQAGRVQSGDRVLDVGTGRGFLAIEIAKAVPGCQVVGIDIWGTPAPGQTHTGFVTGNSKENAEANAAFEGVSDRVEFKQCDARQMPFAAETFDAVVSSIALHQMVHFGRDGPRVLQEIHRVLKPGGRVVDADVMVGKPIIEGLRELGFEEIRVRSSLIPRNMLFMVKILSAVKPKVITVSIEKPSGRN